MNNEYNKEATDLLHKQIQDSLERIETQTTLTNGKVRRITMGLIAVGAFSVGLGIVEAKTLFAVLF
jgi:hypothetical protein